MVWHTISSPANNSSTRFGGEQMNKISNMFNGVDVGDNVTIDDQVGWHFADDGLFFEAAGDRTKVGKFDLSAITTATERTYSWPDFDMEVGQSVVGKHDRFIDANMMRGTVTSGTGNITTRELPTNDINILTHDFDDTLERNVQFTWIPSRYYDGTPGTIKMKLFWTCQLGNAAEVVRWGIKAVSRVDGDTIDSAFGTEVTVEDTFIGNNVLHVTDLTGTITPANAAKNTHMIINIARKAAHANDTLTGDAELIGAFVEWDRDSAIITP